MITDINHIGIAVTNLEESLETFRKIFQFKDVHRETVADQKIEVASFKVGNVLIELTFPTSPESPIAKFIEKMVEKVACIISLLNPIMLQTI